MTNEDDGQQLVTLCLRVTAEADPSTLVRVLAQFQNLNIVPRRVLAELSTGRLIHVRIDVSDLPECRLSLIAAKIGQFPVVVNAYWHRL